MRRFWPFTIKTYAIVLIALIALISGIMGWVIQHKLDTIKRQANTLHADAANEELSYSLYHLLNDVRQKAERLSFQEEARQQFLSPSYYGYWRDNRAMGSGSAPTYLQAIELYTQQGASLAATPAKEMPAHLSLQDLNGFLAVQENRDYLYVFYPVYAIEGNSDSAILGYIGFKLDFMSAIREGQRFNYINMSSLSLDLNGQEHLPLSQLITRLNYTLFPDPESAALARTIKAFQLQVLLVAIGFAVLLYILLDTLLAAPLHRLSQHIDALREGKSGLLTGLFTRGLPVAELEKVRHSLNDYQSKLEEMHQSLNEKNDELWLLAHRDPLTGVYNRRGFEDDWQHVLSVSGGHRLEVAMLLFDCDHFKAINDTYGHQTGDQVIQAITHTLQTSLRQGDRLYRLGGDEFATLFLDIEADLVFQTAQRCVEAVSLCDFSALGIKEPVRISAGLASASGSDTESLASLPKQADIAMYHAKRPGKQKIAVYDESMNNDFGALFSTGITHAIFEAISKGDALEMHYQPVVSLSNGEVDYYEALVRIRDGDELIRPASIFPVIEARRLEAELDLAILGRIEKDLELGRIPAHSGISLNVSGPGVISQKIIDKILSLGRFLEHYRLIVEVTETALITQIHQASVNLNTLRRAGFKIALDDFGSGYSSLGYLANMPVDIIKFDISMIRHLDAGGQQGLIVENLAHMVVKAGYTVVAEGIETEATLRKIMQSGFSSGQGYLFGRPAHPCQAAVNTSLISRKAA
jgi:diguanylate cyclase (GGDEF)-like protein